MHTLPSSPFQMISNADDNCEYLSFDPQQTAMVAYGIDEQQCPPPGSLGSKITKDTQRIRETFRTVIPLENISCYTASANPDKCSLAGIRQSLCEEAEKAGPNGLFIVYLAGHGLPVKTDNKCQWMIAPVDFHLGDDSTYLTGALLSGWLYASSCKAKNILCILHCCQAAAMADALTMPGVPTKDATNHTNIWVMAACKTNELASMGVLPHTTFTHFLTHAIEQKISQPPNGNFPLSAILKECKECCVALSSLCWSYDPHFGLRPKTMTPQLRSRVEPDSFNPLIGPYLKRKIAGEKRNELHSQCYMWLEEYAIKSLKILIQKGLLTGELLEAALYNMMYSMASIQLHYSPKTANDPDVAILAMGDIVEKIEGLLQSDIPLERKVCLRSLECYRLSLEECSKVMIVTSDNQL